MRRIILGLVITLVLGGAVLGATQAFFSDTETSTGNVFVAGSVDLTVDHAFASYNGDDCTEDCTVLPDAINLVNNPGFEANLVTDATGWDIFDNGTGGMAWTVEWVNNTTPFGGQPRPATAKMEFHKSGNLANTNDIPSGWLAQEGNQYTEIDADWNGHAGPLNGEPALVRIYQDIPTVAGKKYELKFWHTYRPGLGSTENPMNVKWNGGAVATVNADGAAQSATVWTEYTYQVVATGALTRLEFEGSGTDNSQGIFLDNVSLKEKTCTASTVGGICNLWPEKNLTNSDIFWNFSDIKPGDFGRNVISLHVEDNDAWACLLIDDVVDNENVIIEPEASSGDVTDNPNGGELSSFIQAFAWNDLDQNGIYEPGDGETALYGPGNLFDLLDGIDVGDANSGSQLISGVTRYVGLAWCVGNMTLPGEAGMSCDGSSPALNVAQTDIMTASVVAYAEQVRNNPTFECSNALLGN